MNTANSKVLVTGGAGFIGSHTCTLLIDAGYEVIIYDNFSNSLVSVVDRISEISNRPVQYIIGDLLDKEKLNNVFTEHTIDAVLHFAGLKAVGESVIKPIDYFITNVEGTLNLINAMQRSNVKTLVFSSSATVYGANAVVPYTEESPLGPTNPYGNSKLMVEQILADLSASDPEWRIACLRYFNPVGAHPSGLIGEDPMGIPNNLLPYVAQVAEGRREKLSVYGGDYPTPDGTGVRDYVHVMDLAQGHVSAMSYLLDNKGLLTLNLGTGTGLSVLEIINSFEMSTHAKVPYEIVSRRPGDLAVYWSDPSKAEKLLNWKAEKSIQDVCTDIWRWHSYNKASLQKK